MENPPPENLRVRLRRETHASHIALDHSVSQFDLQTAGGLACFLGMQASALTTLATVAATAGCNAMIMELRARASRDLARLDGQCQRMPFPTGAQPHPLALDYVIAGSRLGTQVLKRRWQASRDPLVRQSDAYFSAPSHIEAWQTFCHQAGRLPATGPLADTVLRDANRIFRFYLDCARLAHPLPGALHA